MILSQMQIIEWIFQYKDMMININYSAASLSCVITIRSQSNGSHGTDSVDQKRGRQVCSQSVQSLKVMFALLLVG